MALLFISYASEDDRRPDDDPGARGWVSALDHSLKLELSADLKLWRDKRDLDLPGVIRDNLLEQIKNADFFLPVLSEYHRDKDYTRFEVVEFFKKFAPETDPTEFIIGLMPRRVTEDKFLPALSGVRWISFFEIDSDDKEIPFFDGFGRNISPKYWSAIREVVAMVKERIEQQQRQLRPKATVYVARPGFDQIDSHWSVTNELRSRKCLVHPKDPWPVNTPDARVHLNRAMSESQFSIHLLGAVPGLERRSGLNQLSKIELDLAAERQQRDANFRRLIWIPADIKVMDEKQKDLIESLDSGTSLTDRDELVRGGIESFKEIIQEELTRSVPAAGAPP